jgi:membrane protease YdiL (CAAX protease family)
MPSRSSIWLDVIDVVGLPLLIAYLIWHDALPPWTWLAWPAWLLISFLVHRDTPKTLGFRADNLGAATLQAVIVFGTFLVGLIAIGIILHQPFMALLSHLSARDLAGYAVFSVLQQVTLNSLLTNRFLELLSSRPAAAICAGLIFSALHWPNPVLVPLTLIGGVTMAWMFARVRNLIPLAIGHVLLGVMVGVAFPTAWHHHLRVGPGY